MSIIFGRSECPNCKTTLQARDLIPLISFLIQG
ncbi:prepilin peptidase [bacterium]|nr:prepilin peptidase [bacterium]